MPNKTIYVTAADLPLFEQAAKLAGGLSPAIAAALRHYLATQGAAMDTATPGAVELDVTDGPATVRTRFRGRRIARLSQTHETRQVTYEIYRTAKDQFAVYTIDHPDWRQWANDPTAWEDPSRWAATMKGLGGRPQRTLDVYPTADALFAALPDDVADAARRAMEQPSVRELDI